MKYFTIVVILGMSLFCGCKTEEEYQKLETQTNYVGSSFNEEHYVWENFIFTTNRIEKVR